MDPMDETEDVLRQNRSREKQFMFDLALDGQSTQVHTSSSVEIHGGPKNVHHKWIINSNKN